MRGHGLGLGAAEGGSVARRCDCFYERQDPSPLGTGPDSQRRYQNCSFSNFEIHNDSHKDGLKIARQFVKNYPAQEVGLLFIGPCGVGKTHLAVAIIRELIEKKGVSLLVLRFPGADP